jgi:phosphoglycerol transferase
MALEFLSLTWATLIGAVASAACYRLRPGGRVLGWIYFLGLATVVTVAIGYGCVHWLTGQGFNAAARYHLWSGVRHAGWGQFRVLLAVAAAVVAGLWAGLGWVVLCPRTNAIVRPGPWRTMSVGLLALTVAALPAWRELSPARATVTPQFRHHYLTPWIAPGDAGPAANLIYLYLEGLERTYFDETLFPGLVRELRDLERDGISFTNVREVYGTNWTMGGLVASQCGIPLLTPAGLFGGNSMSGMEAFLPGAIGMSDLLKGEGYHMAFLGGANVSFAGKDKFLRTHQFDEVLGAAELASFVPDGTPRNAWGLYDDSLLELAFDKFRSLSRAGRPFALFALTVDTHFPQGHLSPSMDHVRYGDGQNPMLNSVAAADRLVAQFVRRILAEPAARNTVIVLASDHLAMLNSATPQLAKGSRRNLFLILNGRRSGAHTDLAGSSLDIAPTVLASLGFLGEVGLGRSLFEPALQAERDRISGEGVLQSWQEDVLKLWRFPTIVDGFSIDLNTQTLRVDEQEMRLPVLAEISGIELRPKFEFDASFEGQTLKSHWKNLPEGRQFLLIVPRRQLKEIIPGAQDPGTEWCAAFGRRGRDVTTLGVPASRRFDREWIRRAFADQ